MSFLTYTTAFDVEEKIKVVGVVKCQKLSEYKNYLSYSILRSIQSSLYILTIPVWKF